MTILSDRQIKALCTRPTHLATIAEWDIREVFFDRDKVVESWSGEQFKRTREMALQPIETTQWRPMIEPFVGKQVKTRMGQMEDRTSCLSLAQDFDGDDEYNASRIISYGLTSYGYDVRLGRKFKIFTNINSTVIDPMNMSDDCYVDFEGDVCIIPPHSYALGHTIETFDMPTDVVAVCLGKSTYARAGCAINVTPIEPGFQGQVVLELANQTPLPMKVYANMGIAQFMFHRGEPCMVSYADRGGKYQGQRGIVTARV